MKRSHPNYPLPCAKLKSFTSLDKKKSLVCARKTSDVDVHDAVPKYQTDGDTSRHRSAHPNKCLRALARSPQPSPLKR